MKMLRTAAALAFLLVCVPAFAQQTAIHSVPIGKGVGNIGFKAADTRHGWGKPLVSTGHGYRPGFRHDRQQRFYARSCEHGEGQPGRHERYRPATAKLYGCQSGVALCVRRRHKLQ